VKSRAERPDVQAVFARYDELDREKTELRQGWSCPVPYWRQHDGCECDEHRRWVRIDAEVARVYADTGIGPLDRMLAAIGRGQFG
jgi:hypothetical protein